MYLMRMDRAPMTKTLTPYIVKLRSRPVFPYIGLVWARSGRAASLAFLEHLTTRGYSNTRKSPEAYNTEPLVAKEALHLATNRSYSITLNQPNGEKEKT